MTSSHRVLTGPIRSWAAAVLFLGTLSGWTQSTGPRIAFVYPAGARQGASLELTLGGQFLDGVTNALVSGSGVTARVIEHTKPLAQQQFNALREQMRELAQKRAASLRAARRGQPNGANEWTAADQEEWLAIRKQLVLFQRRPPNPAMAETVKVQLRVASDAALDPREIRLATQSGLSNPLEFRVGNLPEYRKTQIVSTNEDELIRRGYRNNLDLQAVPTFETAIKIPATVNGQILPGGVDRYRFTARRGQQLVLTVSARELMPYLADAVPGWFQAALAVYDAKGKEVAFNDDYQFRPDPVIHFEVPRDGEYTAEIRDAIYRGREDFVYRISIGELPFITRIFPLGGRAGEKTRVQLSGWNLTASSMEIDATDQPAGVVFISAKKDQWVSNRVPFQIGTLPETLEIEPNDTPARAQALANGIILNGRIDARGDVDTFSVQGEAGQELVAEVYARRLDSPLDSVLKITDSEGKQLALNDDHEDRSSGLNTHHADSYLRVRLPANGACLIQVSDAQQRGGAEFSYRLRVSPPRPDFELRAVPSSIFARAGLSAPITVYALRKDGFNDEIAIELKNAPEGFALSGGRIPAGAEKAQLTLTSPLVPPPAPISLELAGRARAGGVELRRPVAPAEDMMQAFAYRHLVPARDLDVAVSGHWMARSVKLQTSEPVKLVPGAEAWVKLSGPGLLFSDRVQLELREAPEGVSLGKILRQRNGGELALRCDAEKARPGTRGNLIVDVVASRTPKKSTAKAQRKIVVGSLPAIPCEISAN